MSIIDICNCWLLANVIFQVAPGTVELEKVILNDVKLYQSEHKIRHHVQAIKLFIEFGYYSSRYISQHFYLVFSLLIRIFLLFEIRSWICIATISGLNEISSQQLEITNTYIYIISVFLKSQFHGDFSKFAFFRIHMKLNF